jgi:predicted acyltransferase
LLAGFYAVIDMWQWKRWAFPLVVVGTNSIAAYCIAIDWQNYLLGGFFAQTFKTHLGQNFFKFAGAAYEPFFLGLAVLAGYWLVLYWMYRRKIFLRI